MNSGYSNYENFAWAKRFFLKCPFECNYIAHVNSNFYQSTHQVYDFFQTSSKLIINEQRENHFARLSERITSRITLMFHAKHAGSNLISVKRLDI